MHGEISADIPNFQQAASSIYNLRVISIVEDEHFVCADDETEFPPVAPCIDYGLVPVPLVVPSAESISIVERDPQPGDWQMFARETAGTSIYDEAAWLYNTYTGAVYEVLALCHEEEDEDFEAFSVLAGCIVKVPVKDTYNQPAAMSPYASGLP